MLYNITIRFAELNSGGGRVKRYQLTLKESKEKPSLEEQIIVMNNLRQISQIAATVGHEVRNPLATVRGLLQILLGQTTVDKERKYYSKP